MSSFTLDVSLSNPRESSRFLDDFSCPANPETYIVLRVVMINSSFCSAQHRSSADHELSLSGPQFFFK